VRASPDGPCTTRPQIAAEPDYVIPERSGEVLIVPPLDRVRELLAASRHEQWGDAAVLGVPLAEFRRKVRARALILAAQHTGVAQPSLELPLIAMGHQPLFFHPGVWVKYFLLSRLASEHGAAGLHLIVDTDAPGPVAADVPARRDRLSRVSETLVDLPPDMPLEAAPLPTPDDWVGFVRRVRAHLASLPAPALVDRLEVFAGGEGDARGGSRTLGEFLARLRRRYEAYAVPSAYLELPLSTLADTPEFRAFALHLLRDPHELRHVYNTSLGEYRREHRVRSAANPFPDLAQEGGRVETPFWVVRGGRRTELFAARQDGMLVLASATDPLLTVPAGAAGVESVAASGLSIRPRAMTLTLFARLCLGDLFLHGVSGGRYDRVTDVISARLFGCRPPAYMVATATLHLPLSVESSDAGERPALERRLMDLRHNPDRHIGSPSDAQRRLVEEKWTLIRAVETMRPGPDRRAATRRIREVNEHLAAALDSEISGVEARLASLRERAETEDVLGYRGYSFFLFDPAEVGALVGALGRPS
jgi:hypothetical protein